MLVSAPAGFGKTTLLTEWLAPGPAAPSNERLVAWLSLDRADNDPASFWTYVIAALRTVASGAGESALALLHASPPLPIETVLTVLLNDLSAIAADIVLVLDDYHVIDARDVQDGMAFLLDHLPSHVHVVIAGRADPALPLAGLRARGELVEIRAAELRFTPDEATAYFNGMMGLQLTARDVAVLEARTEGWVAALQLAALSMHRAGPRCTRRRAGSNPRRFGPGGPDRSGSLSATCGPRLYPPCDQSPSWPGRIKPSLNGVPAAAHSCCTPANVRHHHYDPTDKR